MDEYEYDEDAGDFGEDDYGYSPRDEDDEEGGSQESKSDVGSQDGRDDVPSGVDRGGTTILTGDDRTGSRFMSRFEYASLIAVRAGQITNQHPPHPDVVDANPGVDEPRELARLELDDPLIPFPCYIYRNVGYHIVERWDPRELVLPHQRLTYGFSEATIPQLTTSGLVV